MPKDPLLALRARCDQMERKLAGLEAARKADRRWPEKQFSQVEAVANVTARILNLLQVPRSLTEPWKQAVAEGDDRTAMEAATAELLSDLSSLEAALRQRQAD